MTRTTPPPWDEERIGAAYRALTEVPVPDDLRSITAVTSSTVARRSARPWLMAAAAAVVLLVGAVGVATIAIPGGPGPAASASGVPTTPSPSGSSASVPPRLPIIDVAALVALQRGGTFDDRELAVHGYLSPFVALPCPYPGELPVLVLRCPQGFQFLMQDPEVLQTITSDGSTFHGPAGPSVNPRLLETLGDIPTGVNRTTPAEVIALGHLDDARAGDCGPEQLDECRQAFVIDRLLPAGSPIDLRVPAQVAAPPSATHTAAEVVDATAAATGMPADVLVIAGFESAEELVRIQPAVTQTSGLEGPVWLVRLLGADGIGRTFAVADARIGDPSMATFELGRGSPMIGVPGTPVETGSPEPSG